MKYLLLDTNIYINLIANRRNDITSTFITNFAALVAVGGIKIILPEIVQYETLKHLEEQVETIGKLLENQIAGIKELYWLTGFQADELDIESYKSEAQKPLKELLEIFTKQKDKYISEVKESINDIFESENTKIIEASEQLIHNVSKRKIFKKAPLHKESKESLADALIAFKIIWKSTFLSTMKRN